MKVLVIGEDPTHDQFILRPVVEAVLEAADLRARVEVLTDPPLGGIEDALDSRQLAAILHDNPMIDLFLLIVDRDCDRKRNTSRAQARPDAFPGRLIACVAWQEVEVWMLALHREHLVETWSTVRAHWDPKEAFVDSVLDRIGRAGPAGGRKAAMRSISGQWRTLVSTCPELRELVDAVRAWSAGRAPG